MREGKSSILLLMKEAGLLQLTQYILNSKGYGVTGFSACYQAHQWLHQGNFPRLIIMDSPVTFKDEPDFFKGVRYSGIYYNVPILLCMSPEENITLEQDFKDRATDFIRKPFNPAVLLQKTEALLTRNEYIYA